MTDAQLHELLKDNGYTLAVLKGDQVVFHSQERGLKPLYQLYRQQPELLRDSVIADKVTGKAAAVLVPIRQWDALHAANKRTLKQLLLDHPVVADIPVPPRGGLKLRKV